MDTILGLAIIYSIIHLGFLQVKSYSDRTTYEKAVTIAAFSGVALILIGLAIQ